MQLFLFMITLEGERYPGLDSNNILLTGTTNVPLARRVGELLQTEVLGCSSRFTNMDIKTRISESVRGRHVFILNSANFPNPDSGYMEVFFMGDAAERSSAAEITAVIPKMAYDREDRQNKFRSPISISHIFGLLKESDIDRVVTFDIHSEQSAAAPIKKKDILYASYIQVPALQKIPFDNPIYVAPDDGAEDKTRAYSKMSGLGDEIVRV